MGMAPYSLDSPIASVDFQKANTLIGRDKKILQMICFVKISLLLREKKFQIYTYSYQMLD